MFMFMLHRWEKVRLESGKQEEVQRPVIRMKDERGLDDSLILTRINPAERRTSMIIRVRPGWEELRAYLAGETDNKQRCVLLCVFCAFFCGFCGAIIVETVRGCLGVCVFLFVFVSGHADGLCDS